MVLGTPISIHKKSLHISIFLVPVNYGIPYIYRDHEYLNLPYAYRCEVAYISLVLL